MAEWEFSANLLKVCKRHSWLERRFLSRAGSAPRYAVAYSLGALENDKAIELLIALSVDADDKIRDWATFGLGNLNERDTPELRDTLYARLTDSDEECRHEAILGLATRGDKRVKEALRQALSVENVWCMAIEAAKELGDPEFYQLLLRLRRPEPHSTDEKLEEAIERCRSLGSSLSMLASNPGIVETKIPA